VYRFSIAIQHPLGIRAKEDVFSLSAKSAEAGLGVVNMRCFRLDCLEFGEERRYRVKCVARVISVSDWAIGIRMEQLGGGTTDPTVKCPHFDRMRIVQVLMSNESGDGGPKEQRSKTLTRAKWPSSPT
jgi:hypothetical protein